MTKSFYRIALRTVHATALSVVLITLVFPSAAMSATADNLEGTWVVAIPSAQRLIQLTRTSTGVAYTDLNDVLFQGELDDSILTGLRLERLDNRKGMLFGTASFPNHFGGMTSIDVAGRVDNFRGVFSGLLMVNGGEPLDVEVDLTNGSSDESKVVVVVILTAAALGALACLAGNAFVNCGDRCSSSCGSNGVDSWTEVCGSCRCVCK